MTSSISVGRGSLSSLQQQEWNSTGFLVLRNFFGTDDCESLIAEADRILAENQHLISLQNLRCRYMAHHQTDEHLFEVFDPVNDLSPICARISRDPRILSVLESLYDEPGCLFKDKLILKPPGAMGYQLHQDIPQSWKGFPRSFITLLIPIDPSTEENGCTEVFAGYHTDFLTTDSSQYMLPEDCVDRSRCVPLVLQRGDVAFFHGLTPHRSEPNRSCSMRRVLYLSYNALSDGGDQRSRHYEEFHVRLKQHRQTLSTEPIYFR